MTRSKDIKSRESKPSGVVAHLKAGSDLSAAEPDPEMLQNLKDTIDQLPELDATRVVNLHNRIIAGEYEVELKRLTEKLLDLEKDLNR